MYIARVNVIGRERIFELLTTDSSEALTELRARFKITDYTTITVYHVTEKFVWGRGDPPAHPTEQWYQEEQERLDRAQHEELRERFG